MAPIVDISLLVPQIPGYVWVQTSKRTAWLDTPTSVLFAGRKVILHVSAVKHDQFDISIPGVYSPPVITVYSKVSLAREIVIIVARWRMTQ